MPAQRKRPAHDRADSEVFDSLDEMEKRAKARIKVDKRKPLTGSLNLTWEDQEEGYHYYWHSDSDNLKITFSDLLDNGYEFVRKQHGSNIGEKVVVKRGGTNNYLMRIPEDLHLENQEQISKEIARKEVDLNQVGAREYGGDSKELGKGQAVKARYADSPLFQHSDE